MDKSEIVFALKEIINADYVLDGGELNDVLYSLSVLKREIEKDL